MSYQELNIETYGKTSGQIKTYCPQCRDRRTNKHDRSLSVNLNTGDFKCHYCEWKGNVNFKNYKDREWINYPIVKKKYSKPILKPDNTISDKAVEWFKSRGISKETLIKMKITDGLEFMPQKGKECNAVQFKYFKNGELVNIKYRTGDKCFKLTSNAELLPYNIDAVKDTKECIITEGEMDALTFIEAGLDFVISVPNGASTNLSYLDDYIDTHFENKEIIYIAVDSDTKGIILKEELIRRFGADRCKIISYPVNCKDINEVAVRSDKNSVLECFNNAVDIRIDGIFNISDIEQDLDMLFEKGLQKGETLGFSNLDELISFETKRLCVVTGIPNHGKSEFIDEIAVLLNIRSGWRFGLFSPENAPLQYHASKIIEKLTGQKFGKETMSYNTYQQAKQYLEKEFSFISPNDNFKLDNILEKAKILVRKKGIKAIIIDPYNRIDDEQGTVSETKYISNILDKLTTFAKINDILVILMAHPTKLFKNKDGKIDAPTLYDISGSAHFNNKADYGIVVHRDFADDVVEIHVKKVRFKHLGKQGVATFKYNINNGRYVPYNGELNIEWDNSNYISNKRLQGQLKAEKESVLDFPKNIMPVNTDFDNKTSSSDGIQQGVDYYPFDYDKDNPF